MEQFCPLCQKMGQMKKIEHIQINKKESIIICTESKCPWPFGYEKLETIPRDYLSIPKPQKKKEKKKNTVEINKLVLYTPPVTPNEESTSETDSMTLLTTQNYSAEPSNIKKLHKKASMPSKNNKSIFDIDYSTIEPRNKLDESIVGMNEPKKCDNINKLVNKNIKSNGVKIKKNKRQKFDIAKQIDDKKLYVLNELNELVTHSTEINHEKQINSTDNSLPKINNIVNDNIIKNDENILLELNSNLESNHHIDGQFDVDNICALIGTPLTDLPLENSNVANEFDSKNENSNILADNSNGNNNCASSELPDFDNLNSILNEFTQSSTYQTDDTEYDEWLNELYV